MQSHTMFSRGRHQWVPPFPLVGISFPRTTCCAPIGSKLPNPQPHLPIPLMVMIHSKIRTTRRSARYRRTAVTTPRFQQRWHPWDCPPREMLRFPIAIQIVDLVTTTGQVPPRCKVNLARVYLVRPGADMLESGQDVAAPAVHWEFLSMDRIMPAESVIPPTM